MRIFILISFSLALACSGSDASRVNLDVRSSEAASSVNELGYAIALTRVRMAMADLHFTTAGKAHAGLLQRASNWLIPTALAHPGHSADGVVTGELPGPVLAIFDTEGAALGAATLLVGRYTGMNFTFRAASADDGLSGDDPLLSHTAHLEGTATRDGKTVTFSALVDLEEGTKVESAPADFEVSEDSQKVLELALRSGGAGDGATLFDLIDFFALDEGGGFVTINAGDETSRLLGRSLQAHIFYALRALGSEEP